MTETEIYIHSDWLPAPLFKAGSVLLLNPLVLCQKNISAELSACKMKYNNNNKQTKINPVNQESTNESIGTITELILTHLLNRK